MGVCGPKPFPPACSAWKPPSCYVCDGRKIVTTLRTKDVRVGGWRRFRSEVSLVYSQLWCKRGFFFFFFKAVFPDQHFGYPFGNHLPFSCRKPGDAQHGLCSVEYCGWRIFLRFLDVGGMVGVRAKLDNVSAFDIKVYGLVHSSPVNVHVFDELIARVYRSS